MLGLLGEKPLPPKEALGAGECNRGALAGGDGQVVRGMVFCGVTTPGSILTCCIAEPEAEDSDFPDIVGIVNGLLGADLKPASEHFLKMLEDGRHLCQCYLCPAEKLCGEDAGTLTMTVRRL